MKNITKYDINTQLALIKISTKKQKIALLIVSIVLIIFGLFIYQDNDVTGLGLVFGGLLVIIIFVLFWNKLMIKQFQNNKLMKSETYNYYEFTENGFNINTIRDDENIGQSRLKYSDIVKVIENNKFLFLIISNAQALVLSKNDMTEGIAEELILLIKSKVTKYKIIK